MAPKPSPSSQPPKSTSQPKPKSHLDDPPPAAFYSELEKYKTLKSTFDEEKMKPQYWDSIPEKPPNQLPKIELGQPWFDREMEEQMMVILRPEEEQRVKEIEMEDMMAVQKLRDEREERRKKEKEEEGEEEGKGKGKGKKGEGPRVKIDEEKFVRKILGKEGLIVPPGLAMGVKSLYDV